MAKNSKGINKSLDDRFTTNGKGIVNVSSTPENKKAVAEYNAQQAAKKKAATGKKTK